MNFFYHVWETLPNEVVMLKLGLDHLKFKSSGNGVEIESLGQKLSFINFFSFFGQYLVKKISSSYCIKQL